MSTELLAIIMFAVFMVVILTGYPVAFSFAGTAIIFFVLLIVTCQAVFLHNDISEIGSCIPQPAVQVAISAYQLHVEQDFLEDLHAIANRRFNAQQLDLVAPGNSLVKTIENRR